MSPVALLALLLTTRPTHAFLNFFMPEVEVMKLLGIQGDLFYINRGDVVPYPLNYIIMIPANVSSIQFSWQSLTNYSLPYELTVKFDGEGALLPPTMNISSTGVIPTSVQTFRIQLLCTGARSAEVKLDIQLRVFKSRYNNATLLQFQRNKICLKDLESGETSYRNDSIRLDPESLDHSTGSFYVAVACAIALITLVVVATSAICIKNKKKQSQSAHYMTAIYDNNQHVFLRLGSALGQASSEGSGSYATIASIQKSPPSPTPYATSDACRVSYYASSQIMLMSQVVLQDPRLQDRTQRLRALSVARPTITLQAVVEEGIFGCVYRGYFHSQETVIKTIKEKASKRQIDLFLAEGTMLFGLGHKNILPILAVNLDNPKQPLLVCPYSRRGNLKRYLVKCRLREDKDYTLSTHNLLDIAIQILLGVIYLHSQCICYKDLATRNCVVDDKLHIKISDNSLSRDLFPNDYFCLGDHESRPVKWLALESLLHKHYSGPSDVWSFGVTLWEITTLAQQPFADIDPFEMSTHLQMGYRLAQPIGCPDELYSVMTYCWLANPAQRPVLPKLLNFLQDFYTALCGFV